MIHLVVLVNNLLDYMVTTNIETKFDVNVSMKFRECILYTKNEQAHQKLLVERKGNYESLTSSVTEGKFGVKNF